MNATPTLNNPVYEAVTTELLIKTASSPIHKHKTPTNDGQKVIKKSAVEPIKSIIKNAQTQPRNLPAKIFKPAVKGNFSSYERLSRLRERVQKQQREQAFNQVIQQRSVSIMDADPLPVPHTIVPLTREQQYQKNTSTSHTGSITKHDNGTCTIYREQVLGSPVEATTSKFTCGESKFDKNFREHMQKVKNKFKTPLTNY